MARRRVLRSIEDYSRALKDGKGIGVGRGYQPWLRVNDVASLGKSHKIPGIKTDRTHHLLSNHEENFFYCAEFNQRVIDIREGFPLLPLDMVVRLAREAGIKYPYFKDSVDPCVLTTDYLITLLYQTKESYLAVAIKPSNKLSDKDVLARLEIERLWWRLLGVQWRIVTELQLNKTIAQNLKWFSDPLRGRKKTDLGTNLDEILADISMSVMPGVYEWSGLVDRLSEQFGEDPDFISKIIRCAIWERYLMVDLSIPIQERGLVKILDSGSGQLVGDKYASID